MIDTVRLRSPGMSEEEISQIEHNLVRRCAVDLATGSLIYEFTSGELQGSYDSRIMIEVRRFEHVAIRRPGRSPLVMQQPCAPYVVLEGSVHKAMIGHNCYGGPESFQPAVKWFLDTIAKALTVKLPDADSWRVERVDWAECFKLEYSAISDFIHTMGLASFPRRDRQKRTYGKECVFFGGTTTAIKVYHKGPEFSSHDRKRVDKMFGRLEGHRLQLAANDIMRVETSIKAKKLHTDLGDKVTVVQVTDEYLQAVHDRECLRLMKEGKSEMETVRNAHDVKRRLYDTYDGPLASKLYCTWVQLSTLGESAVKQEMTRATWYRQKKQIVEAGISWQGTDVQIVKTSIPRGFSITRESPWRMRGESPEVVKLLEPYRMIA